MDEIRGVPPEGLVEAAHWLLQRHPAARESVEHAIGGLDPLRLAPGAWLNLLADAWDADKRFYAAWEEYEAEHPEPDVELVEEEVWEAWRVAGPQDSPAVQRIRTWSTIEEVIARMIATMHPTRPVEWSVKELYATKDQRVMAVALDWIRITLLRPSFPTSETDTLAPFVPPARPIPYPA